MILELSGWSTLVGVFFGLMFYFWNMINPLQSNVRVKVHCYVGLASLIPLLIHIWSLPVIDFDNWLFWSGVGFFFIIISTGVILLYLPDAGGLRYHARSIHPALLVGLLLIILFHIQEIFQIL